MRIRMVSAVIEHIGSRQCTASTGPHPRRRSPDRFFSTALAAELAELVAEFKERAVAASSADDLWPIHEYLRRRRHEINEKYDYRYSQLPLVFGKLVRDGGVRESQLVGLADDKLSYIRRIASL